MYGSPPSGRQEVSIFSAPGVMVTSARFVVGQQTYPLSGITSVSPFTVFATKNGAILWTFWSALWVVIWAIAAAMGSGGSGYGTGFASFISLCSVVIGVLWWRSLKDSYGVAITAAGMNVKAVVSRDPAFVQHVCAALNQALSMR
jgi:hypothetical protein